MVVRSDRRRELARLGPASEASTVPRDPRVDAGPDHFGAWEPEDREERPHQRRRADKPPEREKPPIDAAPRGNGVHRLVEIGVSEPWKGLERPRVVRVVTPDPTGEVERANEPQGTETERALAVVHDVHWLGRLHESPEVHVSCPAALDARRAGFRTDGTQGAAHAADFRRVRVNRCRIR